MKGNTKFLALLSIVIFSLNNAIFAISNSSTSLFTDVEGHWSKPYVDDLFKRGVIDGAKKFNPDKNITRSEIVKISIKAFGNGVGNVSNIKFNDVSKGASYAKYLSKALELGIISFDPEKKNFRPNDFVNKSEGLKIILKASGLPINSLKISGFSDVDKSAWFYDYVNYAVSNGIISGNKDGTFKPGDNLTRGQITKIVSKLLILKETDKKEENKDEEIKELSEEYKDLFKKLSTGALSGKLNRSDLKISVKLQEIVNKLKSYDKDVIEASLKIDLTGYDVKILINNQDIGFNSDRNGVTIKRLFNTDSIMKLISPESAITQNFILRNGKNSIKVTYQKLDKKGKLNMELTAYENAKVLNFDLNNEEGNFERSFELYTKKPDNFKTIGVSKK